MSVVLRTARRIIGRSRLIALAVLVAVVFFTAGFVELAVEKGRLEARYQQAQVRVERTRQQNALLQLELERAQRGELLAWQAWEMYGKLPKGAGIIQAAAGPVNPAAIDQPEEPFWKNWLKSLGIN